MAVAVSGMILGTALPLIVPLLCFGVLSEGLLCAASFGADSMKELDSQEGDADVGLILAGLVSIVFHAGLASEDL